MARTDRDDDAPDASGPGEVANAAVPAVPGDDEDRELPPGSPVDRLPATSDGPAQPALGPAASGSGEDSTDSSVELPRFVQPDRGLPNGPESAVPPAADSPKTARRGSRATGAATDRAPRPLVSGDPLLTGPTPVVKRAEPPPPDTAASRPPAPPRQPEPPEPPPAERRTAPAGPPPTRQNRDAAPPPPPRGRPTVPPTAAGRGDGAIGGVTVPGAAAAASGRTARRAARGAYLSGQQPATAVARPADRSGPTATLRPTTVAPVPRMAGRRPRVRRVTRVVRHVDPWSVFKVAAVFSLVAYAIALVTGVLLWNVAYSTGTIDNIERGMESTGWSVFELKGGEIFHNAWIGGLFIAVGMTGLAVLVATLFNLITDLVGGVRFTVLEEEVIEKTASPMRRFTTRRDESRPGS